MNNHPLTASQYFDKLKKMNRPAWVKYSQAYWLFLTTGGTKPDWKSCGLQYHRYAVEIETQLHSLPLPPSANAAET